jgi:large subunit ribosomal protein L13
MGKTAHLATRSARPGEVEPRWLLVDAKDQIVGRLATRIATLVRGKHRPLFTPHVDTGDFVIVVNAEKVRFTGRKLSQKLYRRHTGYTGHLRTRTAAQVLGSAYPERVLRAAVRGMLPKNHLGRKLLTKVKIYAGPEHPHAAQKPEEIQLG